MPNIDGAYRLCVQLCNSTNPYCKYSQNVSLRLGAISGGYQWFDCSGLMLYVLKHNGFTVPSSWTTASMVSGLLSAGFTEVDINGEWKPSDILWRRSGKEGHTEMVYSGGIGSGVTMGAHTANTTVARQVSINNSKSYAKSWMKLFRYGSGGSGEIVPVPKDWIYGGEHEYFPTYGDAMKNNAILIHNFFEARGWTHEAIAGMLGNMMTESTLNPAITGTGGCGLVGWTPPSRLYEMLDVIYGGHENWQDGDRQIGTIFAQYEQATGAHKWGIDSGWIKTSAYNISFGDWAVSKESPEYCAGAWMHNYEKPASYEYQWKREEQARWWYNFMQNIDDGGEPWRAKKMPVWMMLRRL